MQTDKFEEPVQVEAPVKEKSEKKKIEPKKPEPVKKEFMCMGRTTYLREYASHTSQRVLTYPITARGIVVEVLSRKTNEGEEWCKVKTTNGVIGYCTDSCLVPVKA